MKMGGLHTFIPKTIFRGRKEGTITEPLSDDFSVGNPESANIFTDADRSIIRVVELLVERARNARASDLHLDPRGDHVSVRMRVDGVLHEAHVLPLAIHQEIVSRIKIISGLRIDEHQSAQDGRFRMALSDGDVDVRVSIVPTYHGENAVLRILSETSEEFSLRSLGFTQENQQKIQRALQRPYGMLLATGPTGSGKTTSMYTIVKILNEPGISVVTLEDPIEYSIPGVRQIQINAKTGLTFGNGLRSLVRQDPNVIMVGEIRDTETAQLAVNTALTGHLVLSTLHTNDAATTIIRFLDMGVEPYLLVSTISLAIGQRLVRRICEQCKEVREINEAEALYLEEAMPANVAAPRVLYAGKGCDACGGSGFRGRAGIHEVLEMNEAVREAVLLKAPAHEIRTVAMRSGMTPMLHDGFHKAAQGITTIEEVLRMRYE